MNRREYSARTDVEKELLSPKPPIYSAVLQRVRPDEGPRTDQSAPSDGANAQNPKPKTNSIISMKKLIALLATVMLAFSAAAGEYADISVNDLEKAIKAGKVTVIDVNGAKSFQKGHIPGAIAFKNADTLKGKLPKDKDALIVAYCGGPKCSAYKRGASAAEKLGYTNIKHLSAGISGWKSAGKKLEKK